MSFAKFLQVDRAWSETIGGDQDEARDLAMLVLNVLVVEPWFHYDLPLGNLKRGQGKEEIATC